MLRVTILHRTLERIRPGVARHLVGGRDVDQQRYLLVVRVLRGRDGGAGTPFADQQLHLLLADQALGLIVRRPRLALAVAEHKFHLVATGKVLRVHFLGRDGGCDTVGLAGPRGIARKRQQNTDLDSALAAGLSKSCGRRGKQQHTGESCEMDFHIEILPIASVSNSSHRRQYFAETGREFLFRRPCDHGPIADRGEEIARNIVAVTGHDPRHAGLVDQ